MAVQLRGIDVVRLRETRHRFHRQRLQPQPRRSLTRGQFAEYDTQGMCTIELIVSIARDHDRGRRAQPPAEEAQHIECPLVSPVHVLDHNDGRDAGPKLAKERGRHFMRRASRCISSASSPPVTCAISSNGPSGRGANNGSHEPHKTARRPKLLAKTPQQEGLPHSGLTRQEDEPAGIADFGNPARERSQRSLPLQERSRTISNAQHHGRC